MNRLSKKVIDPEDRAHAIHANMVKDIILAKRRQVTFHSKGRSDRSGAKIHDEIMAYGFCFNNGLHYGGPLSDQSDGDTAELRHMLGLPACKGTGGRNVNLLTEIYRDRAHSDWSYLSMTWLLAGLGVRVPGSPVEIFTPGFISHLRAHSRIPCDPVEYSVVMHMRRGDVSGETHPKRFTGTDVYIGIIEALKTCDAGLRFTIHTETRNVAAEEISALQSLGAVIKFDAPLPEVWTDMIRAECLVMAKSSFSYVPAMFCRGTVIYQPSPWHDKLTEWFTLDISNLRQVHDRMVAAREAAREAAPIGGGAADQTASAGPPPIILNRPDK